MLLYFPMVIAVFMTVTRDLMFALQINYFDWQTHISPGLCPVIVLHPLSQRPLADRGGQAPRGAAGFRVLWAFSPADRKQASSGCRLPPTMLLADLAKLFAFIKFPPVGIHQRIFLLIAAVQHKLLLYQYIVFFY